MDLGYSEIKIMLHHVLNESMMKAWADCLLSLVFVQTSDKPA
jgi:hypothetical protein